MMIYTNLLFIAKNQTVLKHTALIKSKSLKLVKGSLNFPCSFWREDLISERSMLERILIPTLYHSFNPIPMSLENLSIT